MQDIMDLLDKINEITANSVTPEEFKKATGHSIDEHVANMMDRIHELEGKKVAEVRPIAYKTERRAAAAMTQSPSYGAVVRARRNKQERERLVKVATTGGGVVECRVIGQEPVKICVFSKQKNDRRKKKYVYTVNVGGISHDGDIIRQLCVQVAENVAAREKQQKSRYGGMHLGRIAGFGKMTKLRKLSHLWCKPAPIVQKETMMEAVVTVEGLQLVEVLKGGGLMKQRNVRKGRKGGPK